MQYCVLAVIGSAFWVARWVHLVRTPDGPSWAWCTLVLPVFAVSDLGLLFVVGRGGSFDATELFGSSDLSWLLLVNFAACFFTLIVLLLVDIPLNLLVHRRRQ